ncbi:MAG: ATP-binding cassette domain-containing protein [Bdellovibrionales bacterium]|nr:ATP-binding cassette domain-containing protein [Bdellovibrionales bacterium]
MAVIEVQDVHTKFGSKVIHSGVSFSIEAGSITALIGGSGCGKSVLLREILGLLRPDLGKIKVLGTEIWNCSESELSQLRMRVGMLFQDGALFSALTVAENVGVPMYEQSDLSPEAIDELVELRLTLSGLAPKIGSLMPAELSGGMRKRAALARALALEPEVLFLDEPTSGLDPITARAFDSLIRTLVDGLGITVLLVTHDLDTIEGIVDNLIVLGSGKVLAQGDVASVRGENVPWISEYFSSRARRVA